MNMDVLRCRLDTSNGLPDPLAVYAAYCDNGRMRGTALLESAAPGHAGTQRSLLVLRSALRVMAYGNRVTVDALNANGRAALDRLERKLDGARIDADSYAVSIPAPSSEPLEESERLRETDVFDPLRELLAACAPARAGDRDRVLLVGALAFELAERFDASPSPREGVKDSPPDYVFMLPDLLLDIDHANGRAELAAIAFDTAAGNDLARMLRDVAVAVPALDMHVVPDPEPVHARANCDDAAFAQRVETAKKAVLRGDVFQVVLARHWSASCNDPLAAYARLRRDNPSPCLFFLCDESATLFGASPESAVRFDAASRELDVYPVAGTRPRGRDADEDARLEADLRQDPKEVAEHMMLVDLARNDVARVCAPGTRKVPLLLGVDRYAHVMHLVSRVGGRLRDDLDALHALRACLNAGTLCGAPKRRAMQIIRAIEREARGFYGGAVGQLDAAGNLDTAITIRSATVIDGVAHVAAGAGIVLDSDAESEARETANKARAVLRALGAFDMERDEVAA